MNLNELRTLKNWCHIIPEITKFRYYNTLYLYESFEY